MKSDAPSVAEEVTRLRRGLNDLVSIVALPASWASSEPPQIVSSVLDALLKALHLAFVFVRLYDVEGLGTVEVVRSAELLEGMRRPSELGKALDSALGHQPLQWPPSARLRVGEHQYSIASARLGLQGELGHIVAGSRRVDFPDELDGLLLNVATSQAAGGLQQSRHLSEQRRVARELDDRVARRTAELASANEELKRAEREWRTLVDGIPGMVALLSATGHLDVVNRQVLEYFGQTLEELQGWGTNDTVHPEDLPHVIEVFSRSIASGSPYEIVQRFKRADGAYRWFMNSGYPLREVDGHPVRWCVLLTDIDERKRAEDAVRASAHELKLIIETMPALAWSAHLDGSAEFLSQHYLDFIALSDEQARSWGWTVAVHPDDMNALTAAWQRILSLGAPGEAEARLRRHDGQYRWFLFRVNPLRDESGSIVRWYGVNADIEDRKRAEADLRRAYDSIAEAQRLSKTGSFITDLVADDHNWSDEAYRIFEFDPGTKVTLPRILQVIHPDDLPTFESMLARAMQGMNVQFAFRILPLGGSIKHVRGIAHVIEQVEGRPMFVGALHDVTERTLAEEALNNARSELAHVARAATLSTLTASIAHEVNQPLSGIITNANTCLRMLAANPPNLDGARETARRTLRDGNRASEVIARLRALFSKKDFALESLDLNDATREVIALSTGDLQRNRVFLQSELDGDLPRVTGDRVQLQQVILNLLRNASEAMAEVEDRPRQLLVRTEREGNDRVRVAVRDAGVGFEPGGMAKLFDAFYTTKSGGMGIGLSVSRSIVERHQGRLWAEPNPGHGATFVFSIPCSP